MEQQHFTQRMQAIRERAHRGAPPDSTYLEANVLAIVSDLNPLQDGVAALAAQQNLREQPFVSTLPVLGPLIVLGRTAWNWISTKWYVLPLVQQQNRFNGAVAQTWADLLHYLKRVIQFLSMVYARVVALETRLAESDRALLGVDRSALETGAVADAAGVARALEADWRTWFAAAPVLVYASNPLWRQCIEAQGIAVVEPEVLAADELAGGLLVWETPPALPDLVRMLRQMHQGVHVGAWLVCVCLWSPQLYPAAGQMARDVALGMGFRCVDIRMDLRSGPAFQLIAMQK